MPIPGQFERDLAEINQNPLQAWYHPECGATDNAGRRCPCRSSRQIAKTRE
jgi:hypothetical protein